jgi:hypothetical protein
MYRISGVFIVVVAVLATTDASSIPPIRRSARLLAKTSAAPEFEVSSDRQYIDEGGELISEPTNLPIASISTFKDDIGETGQSTAQSRRNFVFVSAIFAALVSAGFAIRASLMQ